MRALVRDRRGTFGPRLRNIPARGARHGAFKCSSTPQERSENGCGVFNGFSGADGYFCVGHGARGYLPREVGGASLSRESEALHAQAPFGQFLQRLSLARPFQELFEQLLAFAFGQRRGARGLSSLLLLDLRLLLARQQLRAKICERCVGAVEALPTPNCSEEIGLAPFRIARRLLKIGKFGKERFHKS